jgi:putative transposase
MFAKEKNAALCRAAIGDVAKRHGIGIKELAVMPDHVHVVAEIPPSMSQTEAIRILKGGSSYEMFRLNEKFRLRYSRGTLWSRGNFKDSVGRITEEAALNYVRSQDSMHIESAGFSPQFT